MVAVKADNSKLEEMEMSANIEMNAHIHEKDKTTAMIEALSTRSEESALKFETEQKSLEARNSELKETCNKLQEKLAKLQKNREIKEAIVEELKAL